MPWSSPAPLLLMHPNPPFQTLHIQHSACQHITPLTPSQITSLNLPRCLTRSRLVLHTSSQCAECFASDLDAAGYVVEYKPCARSNNNSSNNVNIKNGDNIIEKSKDVGGCEEEVVRGYARDYGGKCWICVFKDKIGEFSNSKEFELLEKL
ncbi:hypothetical protein TWF730_006233 [Orbilia blumenaviensis]|uniref:Uncharacterized protein n=1 Tax=Orbilia blumenaviensis TaxID=1796055 RepID=A0AAV9VG04_9PEZI